VISYKVDIVREHDGEIPEEASICCFHGSPHPWDLKEGNPVLDIWRGP